MNYRGLAKLAIRLFSIYLVFTFIASLQTFLVSLVSMLQNSYVDISAGEHISMILKAYYPIGITWILYIALMIVLWSQADSISTRITSGLSGDETVDGSSITSSSLLTVGFIICGMFILINSLPELITLLVLFALKHTAYVDEEFVSRMTRVQSVHIASLLIKVLISVILIINPHKLSRKILRINSTK